MDWETFETELRQEGYQCRLAEMAPGTANAAHAHSFDAKLLILDGAMTIVCDGERRTYTPGESFAMPAGREHEEHVGPEGVRYIAGRRSARG
jgi:quercetin dioxygenase-like cupin family protein